MFMLVFVLADQGPNFLNSWDLRHRKTFNEFSEYHDLNSSWGMLSVGKKLWRLTVNLLYFRIYPIDKLREDHKIFEDLDKKKRETMLSESLSLTESTRP